MERCLKRTLDLGSWLGLRGERIRFGVNANLRNAHQSPNLRNSSDNKVENVHHEQRDRCKKELKDKTLS